MKKKKINMEWIGRGRNEGEKIYISDDVCLYSMAIP